MHTQSQENTIISTKIWNSKRYRIQRKKCETSDILTSFTRTQSYWKQHMTNVSDVNAISIYAHPKLKKSVSMPCVFDFTYMCMIVDSL